MDQNTKNGLVSFFPFESESHFFFPNIENNFRETHFDNNGLFRAKMRLKFFHMKISCRKYRSECLAYLSKIVNQSLSGNVLHALTVLHAQWISGFMTSQTECHTSWLAPVHCCFYTIHAVSFQLLYRRPLLHLLPYKIFNCHAHVHLRVTFIYEIILQNYMLQVDFNQ